MKVDYLVIGSGLTGAVIARQLKDAGRQVAVLDRRTHLGGNVHDHTHESGIRIHSYGPHYFRTNSDALWQFVNRFADFYNYEPCLKTLVDGKFENWPIAASYIRTAIGRDWKPDFSGIPQNFEEASLAMMPRLIYEKFVKGYTEKQWGAPAKTLAAGLAKRFDVRDDDEPRLMRHKHQGIPTAGYSHFMQQLLADIPVLLNCDYLRQREAFHYRQLLVFTGPIDEFFGFDRGKLMYRGQARTSRYYSDIHWAQPCGQVNTPDSKDGPQIRRIEWKHMLPTGLDQQIPGTVVTDEVATTPVDPNGYEYPFPDAANERLYKLYRNRADTIPNLLLCGRLGEYRYYDMDQAIARALVLAERILQSSASTQHKLAG